MNKIFPVHISTGSVLHATRLDDGRVHIFSPVDEPVVWKEKTYVVDAIFNERKTTYGITIDDSVGEVRITDDKGENAPLIGAAPLYYEIVHAVNTFLHHEFMERQKAEQHWAKDMEQNELLRKDLGRAIDNWLRKRHKIIKNNARVTELEWHSRKLYGRVDNLRFAFFYELDLSSPSSIVVYEVLTVEVSPDVFERYSNHLSGFEITDTMAHGMSKFFEGSNGNV